MKHRSELYLFTTAIAAAIGCTSETGETGETTLAEEQVEAASCVVPTVNVDRSLFVSPTLAAEQTELRTRFSVSRIMTQILSSSGAARPSNGAELWQRWWDTQKGALGGSFADNPHCSDNGQTINGFPVACPRPEGQLALSQPDSHFPVALVYRPDLTPADFSTCGEARIVIAKPNDASGRNLAIFEAAIPNPEPGCASGCRKIAQFWADLSAVSSFSQRLDRLERFYFLGLSATLDGVATPPVLRAANLGLPSSTGARHGQIRTNQFMNLLNLPLQPWQLREFQLALSCTGTPGCKLFFEPVSVKTNPFGPLFNDNDPHPLGPAYRTSFLGQLTALSPQDVNAITMSTSAQFNAGQSNAQGTENDYQAQLGSGNPAGFKQAITNQLAALGIARTADEMAARATTQSCGGCHQLSNNVLLGGLDGAGNPLRWPASAGFVHAVENGTRSPALNNVFLPQRKLVLEQFLNDTCDAVCTAAPVSAAGLAPSGGGAGGDEEVPLTITGKRTVH